MDTTHPAAPQGSSLRLRAVEIAGPAGMLEGLLNDPELAGAASSSAPLCALVCHPHPPSGGTMHNKVVYHAMKALTSLGIPVLRINFRGTGRSEGVHDFGKGEVSDVHAALTWLHQEFGTPILFAGFSFGANVGLRACCGDPRVAGIIALGTPMHAAGRDYTYRFLPGCTQPKLFLSGTSDEFASVDSIQALAASAPASTLTWVPQADHFFAGKLDQVRSAILSWTQLHFLAASSSQAPAPLQTH